MGNRVVFDPKPLTEDVVRTFDFTSLLDPDDEIAAATIEAEVYSGDDDAPSAIISGDVELDLPTRVNQRFTGGELGTVYRVACYIGTCNGEMQSLAAYLAVVQGAKQ